MHHIYILCPTVYVLNFIYCGQGNTINFPTAPTDLLQHPRFQDVHLVCLWFSSLMQIFSDLSFHILRADILHLSFSHQKYACWPMIWCATSDNHNESACKPVSKQHEKHYHDEQAVLQPLSQFFVTCLYLPGYLCFPHILTPVEPTSKLIHTISKHNWYCY